MNTPSDPVSLALTTLLPLLLSVAALFALPVSLALLALYRRTVQRTMDTPATATRPGAAWAVRPGPGAPAGDGRARGGYGPVIVTSASTGILLRRALRGPWRLAAVYSAGGMGYALTLAGAWSAASPADAGLMRFLVVAWIYGWPIVLSVYFVAALQRSERVAAGLAYALILGLLGVIGLEDLGQWWTLGVPWAVYNGPPTLLLLVFLHRRIRAVGPLVFAYLTLALLGSEAIYSGLAASEGVQRAAVELAFALGFGATAALVGSVLLGFALFGALGWLVLRWIRGRYERKEISDQSILLDAVWLLFAAAHSLYFAFEDPAWVLAGLAAFLVYKGITRCGLALTGGRTGAGSHAPRLLLLRVFSLGRRSERMFDLLTLHWRHIGSVRLIAGPDLATTTVEPHEFLDFLTGKLARRFVDAPRALEQRLEEMDLLPDRDGRYRVNEFFCRSDSWKQVLTRLVTDSDIVLMDLRGFSERNAGCRHEIEALIDQAPLSRVVLVTDDTTDGTLLERVIRDGWMKMGPDSPNRDALPEDLCLLPLGALGNEGRRALLGAVCVAAGPAAPLPLPS